MALAATTSGRARSAASALHSAHANAARDGRAINQAASARCIVELAPFRGSARLSGSVLVGVRQQREIACALDRHRQLALIVRLRTGDPARDDLAGLRDVALQSGEILVVDLLDAFGSETAELAAAEETSHGLSSSEPANSSRLAHGVVIVVGEALLAPIVIAGLRHGRRLGHGLVHPNDEITQDCVAESKCAGEQSEEHTSEL